MMPGEDRMNDALVYIFRHNLWANEKLLAACGRLSDADLDASAPGAYGTIRDTLVHLFAAETRYLAGMRNQPRPEDLNERRPFPGFPTLRDYATRTGEAFIEIAASVTPDQRMTDEMRGERYDLPLSVPLAQAINHGTEHRANITTIMSAFGLDAPQLDVWNYVRERTPDGSLSQS
jgi:uncharacterized damage-inducible protein DinB